MPLLKDSLAAATYASGIFAGGGANQHQRDNINSFIGSVYRAHNFGQLFQGYYGLTGQLGNYTVKPYTIDPLSSYYNLDDSVINARSGNKFFGGLGLSGGINIVKSFNGGEWRAAMFEVSWMQEFGEYKSFRKNLPDTVANLIDKHGNYMTFAFGTELLIALRNGSTGFKFTRVFYPRTLPRSEEDKNKEAWPGYLSMTFHVTVNRITGFGQLNFGTHAIGSQLGINCRISK